MPRPKSELTSLRPRNLSARLTEEQHMEYLRMGGSKWLRSQLQQAVNKKRNGEQ